MSRVPPEGEADKSSVPSNAFEYEERKGHSDKIMPATINIPMTTISIFFPVIVLVSHPSAATPDSPEAQLVIRETNPAFPAFIGL
jgi:hypothetical protein